jgi:predicted ATPase
LIQYRSVKKNNSKHSFYDRAIPDIMAYLNIGKIPIGKQYYDALAQTDYQKNVFILPPVKKIYNTDNERLESFEFAQKLHEQLVNTYTNLGFSLIEVPFGNIEERVTFVTDKI